MNGSKEQRAIMGEWEQHTGYEFMGNDKVRAADKAGFIELCIRNAEWMRDHTEEACSIFDQYRTEHG